MDGGTRRAVGALPVGEDRQIRVKGRTSPNLYDQVHTVADAADSLTRMTITRHTTERQHLVVESSATHIIMTSVHRITRALLLDLKRHIPDLSNIAHLLQHQHPHHLHPHLLLQYQRPHLHNLK